jgi:predicted transcriptional regulator
MRTLILAALAVGCLAQDSKIVADPWAGFPLGSWAVIETTNSVDQEATTERQKFTVAAFEGTRPVLYMRKGEGDAFPEPDQVITRDAPGLPDQQPGWKSSPEREERLEIGGKKVACKVTEFTHENRAREVSNRVTIWRTTDVKIPYREVKKIGADLALMPDVVKIEFHVKGAKQMLNLDYRITQLDRKLKVGDREISCVLEEGVEEEQRVPLARKAAVRRWLSDAVPGRVVRFEYSGEERGKPVVRTEAVLSFEVKK